MQASSASYPASYSVDTPEKIANWRPLVQWLLAIPHFVVAYVLNIVSSVVGIISWFAILFTGRLPEGLAGVQCLCLRYGTRAGTYAAFLHDSYPPFTFDTTAADPGDLAPVRVDFQPALEGRNRLTTFFRLLLVIPHLIVMVFLIIGAIISLIIAFFAVLFTGRWPEGLRNFVVGVGRWQVRVQAYQYLLTDEYPPFSLD
jgi:hypothetical protein